MALTAILSALYALPISLPYPYTRKPPHLEAFAYLALRFMFASIFSFLSLCLWFSLYTDLSVTPSIFAMSFTFSELLLACITF